ncbi:hypothetical protein MOSE0_K10814 [Monosporozyma servazzii]
MFTARVLLLRPLGRQWLKNPSTSKCITARLNFSTQQVLFNTSSTQKTTPPKKRYNKFAIGIVSVALLGASYRWYKGDCPRKNNNLITIHEDLKPYTVNLSTEDTPFQTNYTLVGSGVRTLSISTFKVYGMGIYMADEDFPLVAKIIDSNYLSKTFIDTNDGKFKDLSHKEKVKLALNDPVKSEIILNSLLDGGVRLLIKMTPIIKSNLTFIREGGIVKSLKNSPEYNNLKDYPGAHDIVEKGIEEIRKAYDRKGSLVINDDLVMELNKESLLQFYFYKIKANKFFTMGHVEEPLVGKILFRNYLSANKPLCEEARREFVDKITENL